MALCTSPVCTIGINESGEAFALHIRECAQAAAAGSEEASEKLALVTPRPPSAVASAATSQVRRIRCAELLDARVRAASDVWQPAERMLFLALAASSGTRARDTFEARLAERGIDMRGVASVVQSKRAQDVAHYFFLWTQTRWVSRVIAVF